MTIKDLQKEVQEYASSDAGAKFIKLLKLTIHELRIKNDDASPEEFLQNKGAIREFKKLVKGISPFNKYTEYDGGFGE